MKNHISRQKLLLFSALACFVTQFMVYLEDIGKSCIAVVGDEAIYNRIFHSFFDHTHHLPRCQAECCHDILAAQRGAPSGKLVFFSNFRNFFFN